MSLELARKVADAVLYEGYVLYPYRASAAKNRFRFQFGVLAPRTYSESAGTDPWFMQSECVIETLDCPERPSPRLTVRLRFLQLQARRIEARDGENGEFRPVERLDEGDESLISWDQGLDRELEYAVGPLDSLGPAEASFAIDCPGQRTVEEIAGADGTGVARVVRESWPLAGNVRVSVTPIGRGVKVAIRVENESDAAGVTDRDAALRRALVGAHLLLTVEEGQFVSLVDGPDWADEAVRSCRNEHAWPVLVGAARDIMLASPIILSDYPQIAPESPGDLFDATEIDEILTLRVMTMTDDEKREARATDPRAKAIVDRSDSLPREALEKLHGAVRSLNSPPRPTRPPRPAPGDEWIEVGSVRVGRNSRVVLRPRARADTMDVILNGQIGRVEGVFRSVDDRTYVAVTVENDPGADLHREYGRYFYFFPEEIEPIASAQPEGQV